ncbi:MAG: hypothetical protein RIT04_644, partial [Candidatus Parcubacteria bacterium]
TKAVKRKDTPFFVRAPDKQGKDKNTRPLGINHKSKCDMNNLTLGDLVDFLKQKGIPLDNVRLPENFMTRTLLAIEPMDAIQAEPIGKKPILLRDVLSKPGIYKLRNEAFSAAIVITTDGKVLYVNDNYVGDALPKQFDEKLVWRTKSQAPSRVNP